MIRVLIVDDSPTLRQLIRMVLESDPDLQVVGEARNGQDAVVLCHKLQPSIITMDIRMPKMNGFQAIRQIMAESPRPIVVLTSKESDSELQISFKGVEAGALSVIGKPTGLPGDDPEADQLLQQVKAMADVKVVRRRRSKTKQISPGGDNGPAAKPMGKPAEAGAYKIIAIGASTGGPPALQTILSELPNDLSVPVVIVQHISPGFVEGLARWLDETTPLQCKLAEDREFLKPATVYLPPDGYHLLLSSAGRVRLDASPPVDGHCPSVTAMLESVVKHYGSAAIGVLMTGMGRDGARGLQELHQAGGHTIAQDEATSVVFGMPKVAISLGAADEVLPLHDIAKRLKKLVLVKRVAR
ncbi:MAG: chemotaxis response regulator protein-glutamate methylesterase [Chloroflexi bacterium]|nr:chemotaxis response regulator protein-glutamate methylesterase [Chloroflexota bacterium]